MARTGGVGLPGGGSEEVPDPCAAAMQATNIAMRVHTDVRSVFISESIGDRGVDAPALISELATACGTPLAVVIEQREFRFTRHGNRRTPRSRPARLSSVRGSGYVRKP